VTLGSGSGNFLGLRTVGLLYLGSEAGFKRSNQLALAILIDDNPPLVIAKRKPVLSVSTGRSFLQGKGYEF
jgi:hypothetical protein